MMKSYLALDIENDNSKQFKRKFGHFLYDPIVAIGLCNQYETKAEYIFPNKLTKLEIDEDIVVGFNLKHDLLFLWEVLQEFLRRGGTVFDCSLAEYYLTYFQTSLKDREKISLRYLAVNKYGCKERKKLMEPFWSAGLQTSQIGKYLVLQDVKHDTLNTKDIYLQQQEEINKRGINAVLDFQMDYLLATTEMEYNGFQIDKDILNKNRKEIEEELQIVQAEFEQLISKYIPLEFYKKSPNKALKVLFFGGDMEYTEREIQKDENNVPLMIKSGKNKGVIKTVNVKKRKYLKGLGLNIQNNWMTEKGNVKLDELVLNEILLALESVEV